MKWTLLVCASTAIGAGMLIAQQDLQITPAALRPASKPSDLAVETERRIFASGIVEGAQRAIPLHFELEGRLAAINVAEGDRVRQGSVLALLDSTIWKVNLDEAKVKLYSAEARRARLFNGASTQARQVAHAEVRVAEVKLARAEKELRRGKSLFDQEAIAEQKWSNLQHDYKLAATELELARVRAAHVGAPARADELQIADVRIALARLEVQRARTMLSKTQMVAPSDGLILHVQGEPGQLTGPKQHTALITMANLDEVRVRAFVEELEVLSVKVGQSTYVTIDGRPGLRFEGAIISCAPYMVPKRIRNNTPGERVDVKVREVVILLENARELVVGLPVDVFIEAGPPKNKLSELSSDLSVSRPLGEHSENAL